jgi:hypothetical protein
LTAFQHSLGRAETGILLPRDQDTLVQRAAAVYADLGMDLVRDKEGQAALIIPVGLLTVRKPTDRGNTYSTPDGGISLETTRRSASEIPFRALFEELSAGGREVGYSNYNDQRFVVTGTENGRAFYAMFQNAEVDSVGYRLSWTDDNEPTARMLSIFIASHFTALRYMPAEEAEVKIAETPSVTQRFGGFTLPPEQPDAIMLNGEVTMSLSNDFLRALDARPNATILVLNSPGGYVDDALRVAHEVRRRGMATVVTDGAGCYSACAYIFFAGNPRFVAGELGVHQISAEVADLVLAQTTLSDVLDALDRFGVEQPIITVMLRTPPEDMYVFTPDEIVELGINAGGPIRIAEIAIPATDANAPGDDRQLAPPLEQPPGPAEPGAAYVQLALQGSEAEADRSLQYARERWAGVLAGREPEIHRVDAPSGPQFQIRVPARSVENANALCAAIKSAGGGCYVTDS